MLDAEQVFRCMCAIDGGFPRQVFSGEIDAIFVYPRAADGWQVTRFDDGVLDLAARLHQVTHAYVAIAGYIGSENGQGPNGYPGPEVWRSALIALGVLPDRIVTTVGDGSNTRSEMYDYLKLAAARQWLRTIAVTQRYNAIRAMLGTVQCLAHLDLQHLIVPVCTNRFDWSRQCIGPQGNGFCQRLELIDGEFERIERYQRKGDLATLDELYEYLVKIHQQPS